MRKIFKYPLRFSTGSALAEVTMPEGSEVVRLAIQDDAATLWALVTEQNPSEVRRFVVVGTGHALPRRARYVGTWDDSPFVWHVVELLGEPLPDGITLPEDAEDAYRTLTAAGFTSTNFANRGVPGDESLAWIAPDDEPLTTELIMAVATLQEHGFGPVVSK